jgi:MORN repeat variant
MNTARIARTLAFSLPALALSIHLGGCDKPSAPTQASSADPAATPSAPAAAAPKDEVKISKELWPNGKLKYSYEMRRGADGKWGRNGIGRAYYDTGTLEREGPYRDGVRVGQWKYYKPDGTLDRTEDRGMDGQGGS